MARSLKMSGFVPVKYLQIQEANLEKLTLDISFLP